jgi:pilus assembly protein CpaF
VAVAGVSAAAAPRQGYRTVSTTEAEALLRPRIAARFDPAIDGGRPRGELAGAIGALVAEGLEAERLSLDARSQRNLVSAFLTRLLAAHGRPAVAADAAAAALPAIHRQVIERIDAGAATRMGRGELGRRLTALVDELLTEAGLLLNGSERQRLVGGLLDDMLGLGPLEALLADETVDDIMVNGPRTVFVERSGKLHRSPVHFRDDAHVMAVAARIVAAAGRRIDEASPLVDARLADGSRVNIIIPPLAIDGPTISIRKFARKRLDLARMVETGSLSPAMAAVLRIAATARLNILVSGGTGSGKTTLLNALSQAIEADERIVTIEDAAELQLAQPHVVRLETRPANLEGRGEIGMRELFRNALRMRPDRIILGEIRGAEALDMLQAMNTGHDGSLGTIHANRPAEALIRLENMIGMAGVALPLAALRTQIAAAIQMIVQVARMRDGVRRVTSIAEVTGMAGEAITVTELFTWRPGVGFAATGAAPHFIERAEAFGLADALSDALAA